MWQEGKIWRINEQNLWFVDINLYNEEESVDPNHPVLSVWQRIELNSRKIMAFQIGKMWKRPFFKVHQFAGKMSRITSENINPYRAEMWTWCLSDRKQQSYQTHYKFRWQQRKSEEVQKV
jgi:hypothetical protein